MSLRGKQREGMPRAIQVNTAGFDLYRETSAVRFIKFQDMKTTSPNRGSKESFSVSVHSTGQSGSFSGNR